MTALMNKKLCEFAEGSRTANRYEVHAEDQTR